MRLTQRLVPIGVVVVVASWGALLVGCPPAATPPGAETPTPPPTPTAKAPEPPAEPGEAPAAGGEIEWVMSLEEASKTAAGEKKPMMVDFYTDWCSWCKKLDEETYRDAQVLAKSKEFICVKVDAEQDKASADKYSVSGFPTILFLDASGNKIHEVVGFKPAADFLPDMDTALTAAKGG
jgi:thiol:disulfide interchange protein